MSEDRAQELAGPDLRSGVEFGSLVENEPLLGHFDGEPVILFRQGEQVFATGAVCTHYSGPLAEGLVVGETIRCPWHHARFSLRTGEAEGAPALNPVSCFNVRRQGDMIVIESGVNAGEKVITTGQMMVMPKGKVNVMNAAGPTTAPAVAAAK